MLANYHTHTYRCHHAFGSEREYIDNAVARGRELLGFSDHSPYILGGDYYSNYRMHPDETAGYFDTLRSLKLEYANKIELKIGFEAEYYPAHFSDTIDFLRHFKPDYLILGQHFLKNEYDGVYSGSPTDDESILRLYVDQTLKGLETGLFSCFAHPDLLNYTGDISIYNEHIGRLCRRARELGVALEINLLGLADHRAYPRRDFWRIAAENGCDVVLGCDAHEPDAVANPDVLAKAYEYVRGLGVKLIHRLELRPIV